MIHRILLDGERESCYRSDTMNPDEQESVARSKARLRRAMKAGLPGPEAPLRREAAGLIAESIRSWEIWRHCGIVCSFLSLPSEIDTVELNRAVTAGGKILGCPRIESEELVFHRMRAGADSTSVNSLGIREPDERLELIAPGSGGGLLVVVPGLAFTESGQRLGRGGGYYDRFLPSVPDAVTIGLCFDLQIVEDLPVVETDVAVQWILTERRLFPTGVG